MARIKNITAEEALSNPALMQDLQENYLSIDEAPLYYLVTPRSLHNLKHRNSLLEVKKFRNKLYFKREQLDLLFTPKKQ